MRSRSVICSVVVLALLGMPHGTVVAKGLPPIGTSLETINVDGCGTDCVTGTGSGYFAELGGPVTIDAKGRFSGNSAVAAFNETVTLIEGRLNKLTAHVTGTSTNVYGQYLYQIRFSYVITGGTGTFAGATGKGTVTGFDYSPANSPMSTRTVLWKGTLKLKH